MTPSGETQHFRVFVVEPRAARVPAIRGLDPFHVLQWATKALDVVRRKVWNVLREAGADHRAEYLKNARWALWQKPENLTPRQRETLSWIPKANLPLYGRHLLMEGLRTVFHEPVLAKAVSRLDASLKWASRSRQQSLVKLGQSIREHRPRIEATLEHGLTNARVEAKNTLLRLLTRLPHGFRHVGSFIGPAMLKLAGLYPPLPGRQTPTTTS